MENGVIDLLSGSCGVFAPEVNLGERRSIFLQMRLPALALKPEEMSPEVQKTGVSGPEISISG